MGRTIRGFLNREEAKTLKRLRFQPRGPNRKDSYRKWVCKKCGVEHFYAVIRCTSCESADIREDSYSTQGIRVSA